MRVNTNANSPGITKKVSTKHKDNPRSTTDIKKCRGETANMNGHVFQLHSERKNKAQFADTMEALRIYSSLVYKDDIELLIVIFTEPGKPEVKKPPGPKE